MFYRLFSDLNMIMFLLGNISIDDVPKSDIKQSESITKDKAPTTENMHRKMLICQKTNVKKFMEYHKKLSMEIDYKEDKNAKPPYSYAVLICLAMMDIKKKNDIGTNIQMDQG